MGCLRSAPEREHARYLSGLKQLPLCPPAEPPREDGIFAALRRAVPKPHVGERRKNGWISEDTWILVDERVSARQKTEDQLRIRRLCRAIAASLKGERRGIVETLVEDMEALLGADPPMPREAWQQLKCWYKAAVDRAPPPTRATLEQITAERVYLYSYEPSTGTGLTVAGIFVPGDGT